MGIEVGLHIGLKDEQVSLVRHYQKNFWDLRYYVNVRHFLSFLIHLK